ncbi:MAG: ABC transporter ATP-binding protein, partial [Methanosarcinales archaeon]|nr:ABC transporter ATP-binding protein [Methanosarcinales archaeon]
PSGCGKTTLLRIVAGLDTPTSGYISLDDVPITGPTPDTGFVFQEYSLFPWKTVIGNIEFGTAMRAMDKGGRRSASMRYLKLVGLEGVALSYPYELSGGMKQRVAIARALANNPQVLLMDEPFGALDAQTRNTLQVELLSIWEKDQKTIIFVTHSVDEAVFLADRILVMGADGGIVDIHDIDMPRPRDRTSVDANRYRNELLELLKSEREKMGL